MVCVEVQVKEAEGAPEEGEEGAPEEGKGIEVPVASLSLALATVAILAAMAYARRRE